MMTNTNTSVFQDTIEIIKKRFRGNKKFYKEMVNLFFNTINHELEIMNQALVSSNLEKIKFPAHYIKGGANNLGAYRISKLAEKIEFLAEQDDAVAIEQLFQELKKELQRFREFSDRLN